MQSQAGKGDRPRKVDARKYADNYDAIFRGKRAMNSRGSSPPGRQGGLLSRGIFLAPAKPIAPQRSLTDKS